MQSMRDFKRNGLKPYQFKNYSRMSRFMSFNFEKQVDVGNSETQQLMEELLMTKKEGSIDEAFDMVKILDLLTINHLGTPYKIWSGIIHACNLISAYTYAFQASFRRSNYRNFDDWHLFVQGNIFEVVFFMDMVAHFFLDYRPSVISQESVRDLSAIIPRYLKTQFAWDLLPLLPFQLMELDNNAQNLFYLIKCMRVSKSLSAVNISKFMTYLKNKRSQYIISKKKDPKFIRELEKNRNIDYNLIENLVILNMILKTFKLFIMILTLSFILFVSFKVLVNFEKDIFGTEDAFYEGNCEGSALQDYFMLCFGLEVMSIYEQSVIFLYYSFTTLCTVGFGDFHPKSNPERILITLFLLFGVAIFSFILGNLQQLLQKLNKLNEPLDEGDSLNSFFEFLKYYNNEEEFNPKVRKQIEKFFDTKWSIDKNFSYNNPELQDMVAKIIPDYLTEEFYS